MTDYISHSSRARFPSISIFQSFCLLLDSLSLSCLDLQFDYHFVGEGSNASDIIFVSIHPANSDQLCAGEYTESRTIFHSHRKINAARSSFIVILISLGFSKSRFRIISFTRYINFRYENFSTSIFRRGKSRPRLLCVNLKVRPRSLLHVVSKIRFFDEIRNS